MPSNPSNYRVMREPFADADAANKAVDDFQAGLKALRDKCRIAEVYCIISVSHLAGDDEQEVMARLHHGDQMKSPILAAYGYGLEVASHEELIRRVVASAKKRGGA